MIKCNISCSATLREGSYPFAIAGLASKRQHALTWLRGSNKVEVASLWKPCLPGEASILKLLST